MTIKITAREFKTFEEAEAFAAPAGGAAMTMPGQRYLAISRIDCERIDAAGGPETARFIDTYRKRRGYATIEVGR